MHFRIILFLIAFFQLTLSAQNYRWEKSIGGIAGDGGGKILTDSLGNIYTLGFFNNTVDFDPGPGIANMVSTNTNGGDTYILKLDSIGNFVWVGAICGPNGQMAATDMELDKSGNIYITGEYRGSVDFDPGFGFITLPGHPNKATMFILKLNTSGNFVWVKGMGGQASTGASVGLTIDVFGNIIYAGTHYAGSSNIMPSNPLLDFDPGPGVYTITISSSQNLPFVSKLDSAGNFLWAKSFESAWWSWGGRTSSVISDNAGNIYFTGNFAGTVDFDPSAASSTLTSFGMNDIFITKLSSTGNFIWTKQLGGSNDDYGLDLTMDNFGNIVTCGVFYGSGDFDPGPNVNLLSSNGGADIFVSKINSLGNFQWAKSFGGSGPDHSSAITCDKLGNVYTTGGFSTTVDFDPGLGTSYLTCSGYWDMFISKFDSSGTYVWSKSMRGMDSISFSIGNSIIVDQAYNVFTSGQYNSSVDFNPDFGVSSRTSNGDREAFISKLGSCDASLTLSPSTTLCSGNNHTLSANGTVNYTWFPIPNTSPTLAISPTVTAIHSVTGALSVDCQASGQITITVVPKPVSILNTSNTICPDSCSGMVNAITSGGTAPYTYSILNVTSISLPYSNLCNGIYTLFTFDSFNCINSNIFFIDCLDLTSLNNLSNDVYTIYPNPTSNLVNINVYDKTFDYRLYNSLGGLVTTKTNNFKNATIDLKEFPKGVYIIEMLVESKTMRKKIIVE